MDEHSNPSTLIAVGHLTRPLADALLPNSYLTTPHVSPVDRRSHALPCRAGSAKGVRNTTLVRHLDKLELDTIRSLKEADPPSPRDGGLL